ncbi:cofactor-independent phosphoglycerate mutase [Parabacteroides sp. 52]|uniref:cofactor-independent phosphoglycerate mutase n=1 Tax=unclassified Parabacteroides TaxID=2649774 RepID=UPI0013D21D57|nr:MULTISPECIES: cofactor-independent phosphoglycerate mutase [unclassified Parabacteroides]MDH6534482.1 2,3-bisphosphoglycerate-independent phosphoglycerate mutase [Parabacteroides sp. PM5-20]NDV55068.1 cofactor-independent phosphoglycerate mutase [Parabacteroides sp. 52]
MKTIIILADGAADEPIEALGYKTPLQFAHTPYMDKLASMGVTGQMRTVPDGFHPGSEVANLAVLGYDLPRVYEGRGVLEAASIGVELQPDEMAMRCNLICVKGEILKNHSAGHIHTEEADELIQYLNERLGTERVKFHTGVSYRHLLVIKKGDKRLHCTPPHDVPLHPFRPLLIKPEVAEAEETARLLNELILESQKILMEHPVNKKRIAEGKDPANSIWPWSPGYRPAMQTLPDMYGFEKGAVISAVDLIRGIGVYAGLQNIPVAGATGLYDTHYEGKAKAALEALKTNDFVYLHIEASDEAGHEGDVKLKVKTIEYLDQRLVRIIYDELQRWDEPVAIAILPDHPTPCALRTHTNKPIPFILYKPGEEPDNVTCYDEQSVLKGKYGVLENDQFMKELLKK